MALPPHFRRHLAAALAVLTCCVGAEAAEWRTSLSLNTGATFSDNIALAQSAGNKRSDLFLRATPSIGLAANGARLQLGLKYSPSVYYYLDTPQTDYIFNRLNATATLEAVENLVYLDTDATIAENFITPFAPQSPDLANVSANRIETRFFRLSPYVQRRTASGVEYLIRNDLTQTTSNNTLISEIRRNRFTARVEGNPEAFAVWRAEYINFDNQLPNRRRQSGEIVRFQTTFRPDAEWQVFPIVGYETNNYGLSDYAGAVYGGGAIFEPSPRTRFSAQAEERFFGTSYDVRLTHRTRATSWELRASKAVTFWEAPLFTVPPGPAEFAVDQILQARIPDPAQRQEAVDRFLQQPGQPPSLAAPDQFYTTQLFTRENITASTGLIGVRNTLILRLFWVESIPVTNDATGIADAFSQFNKVQSQGASVTGSHQLSTVTRLAGDITRTNSKGTRLAGNGDTTFTSTQTIFRLNLIHQLGAQTSGTLGVRYQTFNFLGPDVEERAILATLNHQFF